MENLEAVGDKHRIQILANCHCLPLADAFALSARAVITDFIDVNFMASPGMASKIDALYEENSVDILFSQNISDNFGKASTQQLRIVLEKRLVTFTNIHFAGLHPDITYIGPMGRRISGFFGDYHSKIVLYSFVTGLSEPRCVDLFNGKVYDKLGYLTAFAESAATLLSRDEDCDVKFAAEFVDMALHEPCLYTVNHATGPVFLKLARHMAAHVGLEFVLHPSALFQNHLSTNYIWPIYREIAEHNKLHFDHCPYFVAASSRTARSITLGEFVAGSYAAYRQADPVDLAAMAARLPFYKSFAETLG